MQTPRLLRLIRVLIFIVSAWAVALYFYPPTGMITRWVFLKSECGFGDTVDGAYRSRKFGEQAMLVEKSRKLQEDGEFQLWETPLGQFWMRGEMTPLNRLVITEQLTDIYGTGSTFGVKKGDIVVDCGADYGMFTRRALQHGAAKVFAVEIASYKQVCLRRTFAREIADGRVIISDKGVWDKHDVLHLRGDSVIFNRPGPELNVPVAPLDDLLAEGGIDRVNVIKFDIEGAEQQAIKGARKTLVRNKPQVIIATENFRDEKALMANLLSGIVPSYTSRSVSCGIDTESSRVISHTTVFETHNP